MLSGSRMSKNAQRALDHLRTIKPRDGWAIECKKSTSATNDYRLLRRTIPLTDNPFVDIYYDEDSNTVVGILGPVGTKPYQGQILVNPQGLPVSRGRNIIKLKNYSPTAKSARLSTSFRTTDAPAARNASGTSSSPPNGSMTYSAQDPSVQYEFTKLVLGIILGLFGIRLLASALFGTMVLFYLVALPAAFLYAVQTCPAPNSFDAKKELKRVLRGHHLPDAHPDKPRGILEEWTARISATLTTELATFPGYQVQQYNLGNAVIGVQVVVPTANLEAYWIGAFHKWHYVYSRNIPSQST